MEEPQNISVHTFFEDYIIFFFRFHVGKASAILMLIGWILYSNLISKGDWHAIRYIFQEVAVTEGSLNASEAAGIEIDGLDVSRVFFSYEVNGELYFGDAYSIGKAFEYGSIVEVSYLIDAPHLARIPETRNAPYSGRVFLWVLVPLAGLGLGILGIIKVYRMAQLLHGGFITTGRRVRKGVLDKRSFNPLVKISYTYAHRNTSHVHHKWTAKPLNYREKEWLVYANKPPYYGMLCKDFPKSIVVSLEHTHGVSLKS